MRTTTRLASIVSGGILALALVGCFNPFQPRVAPNRGISDPPPSPDSPSGVLELFRWCWEHRAITEYREIFTDDFRFVFATTDSAGNAYLDHGWTREDELESAKHLFLGGNASQPAATSIILIFDPNLIALPDSRPGKTDPWHKEIFTRVDLTIVTDELTTRSNGSARFYVVRGDSASIPDDLGFAPNPNRWYIERYEEESALGPAVTTALARARRAPGGISVRIEPRGLAPGALARTEAVPTSRTTRGTAATTTGEEPWWVTWGFVKSLYR